MTSTDIRSALDDATLARMRAEAVAEAGPFVNPALLRDAEALLPGVNADWLTWVTGRACGWRHLSNAELFVAVQAARADAGYLQALASRRREARLLEDARREGETARKHKAERDGWETLRARLPVPVEVWHNWTARHLDGYEQGADHIVVLEDLNAGPLHRTARSPLCWIPSRAHELRHVTANVGDEGRVPNCKACIRHAEHLAEPAPKEG